MTDASFLLAVWFLLCAVGVLVWRVAVRLRRPFDMPLAYALTLTALAVVRNADPGRPLRTLVNGLLCFTLYYLTAWLVRFVWRLGLRLFRQLRRAETALDGGAK